MKTLLLTVCVLFSGAALAACSGVSPNLTAASASTTDVQACVTAAVDGDTVNIPAGSVTWTAGVHSCKSLTYQGAGQGVTNITINNAADDFLSLTSGCTGKTTRVTAITFAVTAVDGSGIIQFFNCYGCTAIIDHITANCSNKRFAWIGGTTNGVMHHNTLTDCSFMRESVASGETGATQGNTSWTQAQQWGTSNHFYAEDNSYTFTTGGDDIDCQNGGLITYRHNTFTKIGTTSGTSELGPFDHGQDSANSCKELLAYSNTFTGAHATAAMLFRGGSGLIYSNVIGAGPWDDGFSFGLTNYRSSFATADTVTHCDGTDGQDGNSSPIGTYRGWPCNRQIGRGQNNDSYPLYSFNNCITTLGCTPGGVDAVNPTVFVPQGATAPNYQVTTHILANRDYYNMVAGFDGSNATGGVGQGLLAARPATCSVNADTGKGPGYWGTDTSTLYQCTSTNTWSAYYVEYTYPYPGIAGSAPTCTLTASPLVVKTGTSSTLTFTPANTPATCSIDNGVGSVSCAGATPSVSPSTLTTYTATVTNASGSNTCTASVTIGGVKKTAGTTQTANTISQ